MGLCCEGSSQTKERTTKVERRVIRPASQPMGKAGNTKTLVDQALQMMRKKPTTKGKVDNKQAIAKMTKLWEK